MCFFVKVREKEGKLKMIFINECQGDSNIFYELKWKCKKLIFNYLVKVLNESVGRMLMRRVGYLHLR